MEKIKINTEYIKLSQFLKWIGAAESGALATTLIKDGRIKVNDTKETRRGRKLYKGDRVIIDDIDEFLVTREG